MKLVSSLKAMLAAWTGSVAAAVIAGINRVVVTDGKITTP